MDPIPVVKFDTHAQFEAELRACIARSAHTLQLFDPDYAVYPLGSSEMDAALRQFLAGGGRIELAMHRSDTISLHYPRFLRLLKDFGHRIECRSTPRTLHMVTDSFCIGDGVHIVRRYHCDHMRGEACCNSPADCEISLERFGALWVDALPGLHATTTGL
ncbi:MAG: hypothetical protein V4508_18430 [Pseudomonadota bacterium]